ncbi:hypothetical protein DSL72_007192 [Monilinia vaccinii-corymbosi]|uniref:Uncharacterized protein n=1 Tax=Monilinia vaccinii-corymbosi TaxID=61207 RepID=A0A8A3PL56_9HELO|nr:hypothetical protein DSL72_007192 [Monilinia vaccinii-corymbosi]
MHGRILTSRIHNWSGLLSQCWDHLEPGRTIELWDICHPLRDDGSTIDDATSALIRFECADKKNVLGKLKRELAAAMEDPRLPADLADGNNKGIAAYYRARDIWTASCFSRSAAAV